MNYIDFIRHFNIKVEKGNKAMAICPAHNDKNPSLCITLSQDREKILIKCFAGCETRDILSAVNLKMSDLYTHIRPKSQAVKSKPKKVNETCYKYYDADGSILYTKVRNDYADGTKDFFFQNSKGGKTLKGVKTVPYNLPQVLKSSTVYFVEGEKCADAVIKEGYCATTLHAGAKSKWESDYARYFEGRQVIVIPDNDKPGFEYARKILAYLPGACMKVIPKENIPDKYDIADFLRDGGSMKDIENASVYTELEEENADSDNQEENSSKSQIEIAMELIKKNGIKVCVNQSNEYWGIVQSGEHTETFLMKSDEFKAQFRWMFYQETKKVLREEYYKAAIEFICAQARMEGEQNYITSYLRVGKSDTDFYYDLTNPKCQKVKINAEGWEIKNRTPVVFERYPHQEEQVLPEKENADINKIFDYVNVEKNKTLFLAWLVSCFVPEIPHAIAVVYGEKGSAKTSTVELLKKLIDPSKLPSLDLPSCERTLPVNFKLHWFINYDNVSFLKNSSSDIICRAVTGSGIEQRALGTNSEQVIYKVQRCFSFNGIGCVAEQSDLLDRSILFELTRIPDEKRKELSKIYQEFEGDRGKILGGIFNVLSKAMQIYPSVELEKLSRMADFTHWGYAIAEALGGLGEEFLNEYEENMELANAEALNSDVVGVLLKTFMEEKDEWSGYVKELFTELQNMAKEQEIGKSSMPKQPNGLTRKLNSIKSNLSTEGIVFERTFDSKGTIIHIKNNNYAPAPPCSANSEEILNNFYGGANKRRNAPSPEEVDKICSNNGGGGHNDDELSEDVEF